MGSKNSPCRIPTRHLSGLCWSMAPRAQQATLRSALRTASLAIFAQRYHHVARSWASLQRVSSAAFLRSKSVGDDFLGFHCKRFLLVVQNRLRRSFTQFALV